METDVLRWQNLYLTAGLNLTYPQGLFFPLTSRVDHVAAIGRDGHVVDSAAVGKFGDLHVLEPRPLTPREPMVDSKSSGQAGNDNCDTQRCGTLPNPRYCRDLC